MWEKFACNSKSEQEWYYGGFVELLKEFAGEPVYEEYKMLVERVWGE